MNGDADKTTTREAVARAAGVSVQSLDHALTVARYAEHLVQDVIDGVPGKTLDAVYRIAQENKRQQDRKTRRHLLPLLLFRLLLIRLRLLRQHRQIARGEHLAL